MSQDTRQGAWWSRALNEGHEELFATHQMTQVTASIPALTWEGPTGRYLRFGFERTRYSDDWSPTEKWVGRGGASLFGARPYGQFGEYATVDEALDFFEVVREVPDPYVYPSDRARRAMRPRRYLPVVANELLASETIFAEIYAWVAATRGVGLPRQVDTSHMQALRDRFLDAGVDEDRLDTWISDGRQREP